MQLLKYLLFILTFWSNLMAQPSLFEIELRDIRNQSTTLAPYQGKVLLIVNTASKCGFTPQFEGLQKLYETYGEKGLVVLGFPCNQFASQEPLDETGIESFCRVDYGVTFPMFSKIEVNGPKAHPLYQYLKAQAPGILGSESIKWNFTKFLINREGKVVERYAPSTTPDSLKSDIEKWL